MPVISLNTWMLLLTLAGYCLQACTHATATSSHGSGHLVEKNQNGSVLYVDTVNNRHVLKETGNGSFSSFKIGFRDSLAVDAKLAGERTVYFNYRMQYDWKAVINGDSILPVFYQPTLAFNALTHEGILVFECLPGEKKPDTLVYHDSYGNWQQQIIVLKK